MSKSVEQQAADIIFGKLYSDAAAALTRAGLLVSERDVLCREYVAAHLAYTGSADHERRFKAAKDAIRAYDREHAPKPRFYVEAFTGGHPDTHRVIDRSRNGHGDVRGFGTEAECIAIMNALAEKEAGR